MLCDELASGQRRDAPITTSASRVGQYAKVASPYYYYYCYYYYYYYSYYYYYYYYYYYPSPPSPCMERNR